MSMVFKYQAYLQEFPNCPPNSYKTTNFKVFRWVNQSKINKSFLPLNVLKYPPIGFDNTDTMCKSYGLSVFDTFENAFIAYKKIYQRKGGVSHQDFIEEKGDCIALLDLQITDGVIGDLNKQGHLTLHEYIGTDLIQTIVTITKIIDQNGNFII